jgi:hypothetical protein
LRESCRHERGNSSKIAKVGILLLFLNLQMLKLR